MKFVIVLFACVVVVALAGPVEKAPPALVKHVEHHDENGYSYEILTDDGTKVVEHAKKVEGPEGPVFRKQGSYEFESPEGEKIVVKYVADENGYRAEGPHLPKAVAI